MTILPVLSTLLCFALGLFTLSRNPRNRTNISFALGMAALGVAEAGSAIALLSSQLSVMEFGIRLSAAGSALLPPLWLIFSLLFARTEKNGVLKRNTLSILPISIAALFFIAMMQADRVVTIMSETLLTEGGALVEVGDIGRLLNIYMIVGLVLVLIHLENTLRCSKGLKRWQIKYIILGIGSILAFKIYLASQSLLFQSYGFDSLPLSSAVTIISTSVMAVFIVRHRLMDVDVFISRYIVYNSLTVLIVGIYLLATGLVIQGIRYFQIPYDNFLVTLFTFTSILLLFILIFMRDLRRRLQIFVSTHFYKHKHEFRDSWMETTERISSKRSIDEINSTLISLLSETLGSKRVYLWLQDRSSSTFTSYNNDLPAKFEQLEETHPLVLYIKEQMAPFFIDPDSGAPVMPVESTVQELAVATGTVLCAPVLAGQNMIGFLLISEDASGKKYGTDDFEILRAMTTQAAVQIITIRLSENLVQIKEVEVFSRMSSFIMHDLKNLTNSLSLISQNAKHNIDNPEFQKDAITSINGIVARMKGLIGKLSDIPKGLEINRQPVDIKYVVDRVMKKIPSDGNKEVLITEDIAPLESVYIDPEAIEMVLHNLISNAYEAIEQKGSINISVSSTNQKVCISVKDNGKGMSRQFVQNELYKPFSSTKKMGFGIGLFHCKAVVEAHGGKIDIITEEGTGTTFKLTLPDKES